LASKKFPEGLIVGVLPSSYGTLSIKDSKSTTRSVASAISNGSMKSSRQSTAASVSSVKTLTSIHEKPFR